MSNHKNLVWFNKEGDYLNFNYNETNDKYEGDIIFHESASDIYKTFGLYMFEEVPSFEFSRPDELSTRKFQLFNERGINFYGSDLKNEKINKIEPVNNNLDYNSKWIYGDNFESKFPIGSMISFDSPLLEFNNVNKTYIVNSNKKDAILILSQVDNKSFEVEYGDEYKDEQTYIGKTISGINSIGVYDYIDIETYEQKLSEWNEPNFYDRYFLNQKLNINNTKYNNKIVTVNNKKLTDIVHFEYILDNESMIENEDLIIEVITKTDLQRIYKGDIDIDGNKININPDLYPDILKPGTEFKIIDDINGDIFLFVDNIQKWSGILNKTDFFINDQIIYNNKIYQCFEDYTQDFTDDTTSNITPENSDKWGKPTFIITEQTTPSGSISNGEIYLTSDTFHYRYNWDTSIKKTLASSIEKYKNIISIFNIDISYTGNKIIAKLIYPNDYAVVNFYYDKVNNNNKIGSSIKNIERLVGVEEKLNRELNTDISELFDYKIVFTDIDEFGIKIIINGEVYEEEVAFIFSGNSIDMERTIDKTLRNWLSRNHIDLNKLGITTELKYTGNSSSLFYNSIRVLSHYPNVSMEIDDIRVGTTANYFIEHSKILFNNIGAYFNININNIDYGITVSNTIGLTLERWVDEYFDTLLSFGIIVKNVNELLIFNVKKTSQRLDFFINTGKANLPGVENFTIQNMIKGNEGVVITSNEIILKDRDLNLDNFEESGFATGMLLSINNTKFPLVNREYVIQYLDTAIMNISYEGPFWGLTDNICDSSAFVTLAFNNGFDLNGCLETGDDNIITSPFNDDFTNLEPDGIEPPSDSNSQFEINFNSNDYNLSEYDISTLPGTDNMVDLIYIQLSDTIYTLADDIIAHDASNSDFIEIIDLPNNNTSIKILFNVVNNYIYTLSEDKIYVVNPLTNNLIHVINLQNNDISFNMEINPINGDVYITYQNSAKINIWDINNFNNNPTKTIDDNLVLFPSSVNNTQGIVFNDFENDMYVTTDNSYIIRINSDRTINDVYFKNGAKSKLFYEPVDESIYFYANNGLCKIDNGNIIEINDYQSNSFYDIIFNNLTGEINISSDEPTDGSINLLDISSNDGVENIIDTYGYLGINQFDGGLYLTSQNTNELNVINPNNGSVIFKQNLTSTATKIINNPQRNSMWAIQPDNKKVIEILVKVNSTIEPKIENVKNVGDNLYGTLNPDFVERQHMWLKTRDYIRKPRENFQGDVQTELYWKWLDNESLEFFMYDFSGNQLIENKEYTYKGVKPLNKIVLNRNANKDLDKVFSPEYQQTIFDKISYEIPFIDDDNEISTDVEPLELFLGYKSLDEGAYKNTLRLFKKEEIKFDIISDEYTNIQFSNIINNNDQYSKITLNESSPEVFINKGLKPEQYLVIYLNDITNDINQYSSENMSIVFKIREVFSKSILLDPMVENSFFKEENTKIENYPNQGDITYLKTTFKIADKEIGRFNVYGQTEEEDERFKIELGNIGKLIGPDDVFIFNQYDIQEGGIDWTFLNKKRKELLMNKHLIYPYIGAYKSIINAINFFGYNDLELNEYYRNINPESENFSKLFKVEIPDIFNNSIKGWEENDFIKNTFPNKKFEETKLFNLTYKITDKEGNNVLNFTLDEVIIKLQGLKFWLENNIIPLTHKILDITGVAYVKAGNYIQHKLHDINIINIKENMTPITFKINECYLMPINSGSSVYNCVIDLSTINKKLAIENTELTLPNTFDIKIRTYKSYKEWEAFKSYKKGDKVKFLDFIYESMVDGNKTNNPTKYNISLNWSPNKIYQAGTIIFYNNEFFSSKKDQTDTSSLPPVIDTDNWLNITRWKKIDLEPVQTITEFRKGDNLLPHNFTVDSNVDPFIVVEVTSDNGYGEIYRDIKNYELKGIDNSKRGSVNEISNLPNSRTPLNLVFDVPTTKPTQIFYTIMILFKNANGKYFDNGSYRVYERPDNNEYFSQGDTDLTILKEFIDPIHDQNATFLNKGSLIDVIVNIDQFGRETYDIDLSNVNKDNKSVIGLDRNSLYFINIIKSLGV